MKEYKNGSVKFELDELNTLTIFVAEAANYFRRSGLPGLEKEARTLHSTLFKICENHGLYDDCETYQKMILENNPEL